MKKMVLLGAILAVITFGGEKIFTGSWCVVDDDMVISFLEEGKVSFESSSDATTSGMGSFTVTGDTLQASIVNDDMEMGITYLYKSNNEGVQVQTIALNGQPIESNDEWVQLIRCEEEK